MVQNSQSLKVANLVIEGLAENEQHTIIFDNVDATAYTLVFNTWTMEEILFPPTTTIIIIFALPYDGPLSIVFAIDLLVCSMSTAAVYIHTYICIRICISRHLCRLYHANEV